jgi:23S rRNA pseudouridine1911/1915/1917 synthase
LKKDSDKKSVPRQSRIHGSPFTIIHEDRDILVANKKAGILTVPIPGKSSRNLEEIINDYLISQKRTAQAVHRIDRFTSGLVVFGKGRNAWGKLVEQFKEHTPERLYLAVVRGTPRRDEGTLRHQLRLTKNGFRQMVVKQDGTLAITHYKILEKFEGASLLEVRLETGLKNQIRVQFRAVGNPLVGDRHYSPDEEEEILLDRQALHAWKLSFRHPTEGRIVSFEAPLPQDMESLIARLRKRTAASEKNPTPKTTPEKVAPAKTPLSTKPAAKNPAAKPQKVKTTSEKPPPKKSPYAKGSPVKKSFARKPAYKKA